MTRDLRRSGEQCDDDGVAVVRLIPMVRQLPPPAYRGRYPLLKHT